MSKPLLIVPQNKETRQQLMAIETLGKLKKHFDSLTDEEKREFKWLLLTTCT